MSTPRNPDLRVVGPAGSDADGARATLRIDAERPVPAPPHSAEETREHRQAAIERELDRIHQAATAEQSALSQNTNWLIASQAILIHAFLMVFIVGSMGAIRLNHWLLGGLALLGIVCAVVLHGSLDRGRQTLALLLLQRRAAEIELAALTGRQPSLPKTVAKASSWLGPAFVIAWLVLLAFTATAAF